MSALGARLKLWLNGTGYSPGHFITDDDFRSELQLGDLLDIAATLEDADTDDAGSDLIGVNDTGSVFTATTLTGVLAELYTAATSASSDTFTDTNGFYATDTVGAAFVALGTALGGSTSTTRNFTNGTGTRLTDNQTFFAALDALDQGFVALRAVSNANGASLVGIEDAATYYAALNVEAALVELGVAIGGATSTTRNYSSNLFVADNDSLLTAIGKLDAAIVDGGLAASAAVSPVAGVLTVAGPNIVADVEGGADPSDDIDTITGLDDGQMMALRITDAGRNIVITSGVGNILTPYGFSVTLDLTTDVAFFRRMGASVHLVEFRTTATGAGGLGLALASGAPNRGASLVTLEDAATYFATDTVESAIAALAVAIGGATSTTRNYSSNVVIADNDTVLVALGKLDQYLADLAAISAGDGATLVGVEDAGGFYDGATVEACLANLATALGGSDFNSRNYTEGNVVTDDQAFFSSVDALDVFAGDVIATYRLAAWGAFDAEGTGGANIRQATLQVTDPRGASQNETRRLRIRLWDDAAHSIAAVNGTVALQGGGDGAFVSGSGTNDAVVTTAVGNGQIDLAFTEPDAATLYVTAELSGGVTATENDGLINAGAYVKSTSAVYA